MRKSRIATAETRRGIVETAAAAFRRDGVEAASLADIMAAAGLTQGGFYRHFDSKSQLVAEACAEAMRSVIERMKEADGASDADASRGVVERYLSAEHVDNRSGGCPLASLGSELAREDQPTRAAAANGFLELVEMVAARHGETGPEAARERALFAVSAMIGAVTMSRIVTDPALAADILQATKRQLTSEVAD